VIGGSVKKRKVTISTNHKLFQHPKKFVSQELESSQGGKTSQKWCKDNLSEQDAQRTFVESRIENFGKELKRRMAAKNSQNFEIRERR
jgi:hypothetical protein